MQFFIRNYSGGLYIECLLLRSFVVNGLKYSALAQSSFVTKIQINYRLFKSHSQKKKSITYYYQRVVSSTTLLRIYQEQNHS